jgi:hypothetical protein
VKQKKEKEEDTKKKKQKDKQIPIFPEETRADKLLLLLLHSTFDLFNMR